MQDEDHTGAQLSPWATAVGPTLLGNQVARLLGIPETDLAQLVADDRVLEPTTSDGYPLYPAWQFSKGKVQPGLQTVLELMRAEVISRWTLAAWCRLPQDGLGGRSVAEVCGEYPEAPALRVVCSRTAARWSR